MKTPKRNLNLKRKLELDNYKILQSLYKQEKSKCPKKHPNIVQEWFSQYVRPVSSQMYPTTCLTLSSGFGSEIMLTPGQAGPIRETETKG